MILMAAGFAALAAVCALTYLLRRHEEVLRLRAQVTGLRFTLDTLLRRRRELAQIWGSLCEERELLTNDIRALRRKLAERPEESARFEQERQISALVRGAYASFLDGIADEGPSRDFFRQYFASLTRLEKEIGDAIELYNDSVAVHNRALGGPTGWIFRRWERLAPQAGLPVPDDSPRARRAGAVPAGKARPEPVPPVVLGADSRS